MNYNSLNPVTPFTINILTINILNILSITHFIITELMAPLRRRHLMTSVRIQYHCNDTSSRPAVKYSSWQLGQSISNHSNSVLSRLMYTHLLSSFLESSAFCAHHVYLPIPILYTTHTQLKRLRQLHLCGANHANS